MAASYASQYRARLCGVLMEVTCRCGWVTRGSKSEVVENVREHGRSAHRLQVTPDEVRAIWRAVSETADDRNGAKK